MVTGVCLMSHVPGPEVSQGAPLMRHGKLSLEGSRGLERQQKEGVLIIRKKNGACNSKALRSSPFCFRVLVSMNVQCPGTRVRKINHHFFLPNKKLQAAECVRSPLIRQSLRLAEELPCLWGQWGVFGQAWIFCNGLDINIDL